MGEVIIVGGGASGLMAAIFAARLKHKVTVLEHKDKIGKKILATGNGKCNYTNLNQQPEFYRGKDSAFAMKVLSKFDVKKTMDFFEELGIYPRVKNGYVYPNSEQASSVLEVLKLELNRLKVTICVDVHVEHIHKSKSGYLLITNKGKYQTEQVILATGGCASKNLGSDGSGYSLAEELGHRVIKPLPALVQLKAKEKYFKTLAGVRAEAVIKLIINDKPFASEKGELLIAAYGVSGIPILQISRFASQALEDRKKVTLTMDFLPEITAEEGSQLIETRIKRNPERTIEGTLLGLLNNKIIYIALLESGISPETPCRKIDKASIQKLTKQFKEWKITITEPNPFDQAQVTAGGVDTGEIDPDTLESRLCKGLYIVGELADIDGTCGGYNLQWAWSTGAVAGMSLV